MALGSTQPLVKMSTRNIPGGKGGRCVRLTTSPPPRAECHEIWEPKPPGTLWATPGLLRDSKKKFGSSGESFTLLENRESFKKQNVVFCITVCITFYYTLCSVVVLTNSASFGVSHWFTFKIILFVWVVKCISRIVRLSDGSIKLPEICN